ncbi:MAG: nucleotidyltransferase domain-containing protein [Anaerolineaceae bacterium]
MASRVQLAKSKNLIQPPKWLPQNIHYEVITGSVSYGVSSDTSDMDIVGFCIPPKEDVFPHLRGEIPGFGIQKQRFEVWQQHHIKDDEARTEYDFAVYSIVKFFHLAMENNPNMVDIIHVPQRCVLFASQIGQLVRDNRNVFLSKKAWHKFRGYAYSQLHKIGTKSNASNPKRQASIEKHGYDVKFAYHTIRLLLECEQILVEHDLDLERNSEILKSIRRGEWSEQKIRDWFDVKEKSLEEVYNSSSLRHAPDKDGIKELLLQCLEIHYGSIDGAVKREVPVDKMIRELREVLDRYDR